jgi:hypothetical protein
MRGKIPLICEKAVNYIRLFRIEKGKIESVRGFYAEFVSLSSTLAGLIMLCINDQLPII